MYDKPASSVCSKELFYEALHKLFIKAYSFITCFVQLFVYTSLKTIKAILSVLD